MTDPAQTPPQAAQSQAAQNQRSQSQGSQSQASQGQAGQNQAAQPPLRRRGAYETVAVVGTQAVEARARAEAKKARRASLKDAAAMLVLCMIAVLSMTVFAGIAGLVLTGGWRLLDLSGLPHLAAQALQLLFGWLGGH